MIILGIETSCDETSAAILEHTRGHFIVRSQSIFSQSTIHAKTGGVVPEVAAREHSKDILPIIDTALQKAKVTQKHIDTIAVTYGPGLHTSLLVGVETAKMLAYIWGKKLVAVNHLAGHIYANTIHHPHIAFPLLALIVSGGHTELVLMNKHLNFRILGQTRDDAAGEAFDKVAKLLGLGYPGGPLVSAYASKGNAKLFFLPRPMIHAKNFDFSFSGLKTAVSNTVHDTASLHKTRLKKQMPLKTIADLCASFEQAIVDTLVAKTLRAAQQYHVTSFLLGGGVAANKRLRYQLKKTLRALDTPVEYYSPPLHLCTDNAAMIAAVGYYKARNKEYTSWKKIRVDPRARL